MSFSKKIVGNFLLTRFRDRLEAAPNRGLCDMSEIAYIYFASSEKAKSEYHKLTTVKAILKKFDMEDSKSMFMNRN